MQTGGAGDGSMWREYVPRLREFRVVLIDHRGRGRTDHAGSAAEHHMNEYVEDVVAVADALHESQIGFVGYSMGAEVGYALASAHPELVASLVGLGVAWTESEPGEDDELIEMLATRGMRALVDAV